MIFVKGMQIKKLRGFLCKRGGVRCLPWPMVAGHGERERKRALMGIFWKRRYLWRGRYFERDIFGIWWKEKKKERKRKEEKKMKEEDIFSNLENENIGNTVSRDKVEYAGK